MRILDKATALLDLADLGFSESNYERYSKSFTKPYGTILVTGPTGSGKSTTLYATLNTQPARSNIITVEDPVEYRLPGINQVQINTKAGLTFAAALRSILRSDPDIVLVGEIRDQETARSPSRRRSPATSCSRPCTPTTPPRAAPGSSRWASSRSSSSALDCVVAQRLARRLCTKCKETYTPTRRVPRGVPVPVVDGEPMPELFRAVGLPACAKTGYKGRFALHEVMLVSEEIERLIVEQASATDIKKVAMAQGMSPCATTASPRCRGHHLPRGDPPRRRVKTWQGRQRRSRAGPIGRSSRETGVRGLRYAVARGVSRWRRPDTSRCRASRELRGRARADGRGRGREPGHRVTYSSWPEPSAARPTSCPRRSPRPAERPRSPTRSAVRRLEPSYRPPAAALEQPVPPRRGARAGRRRPRCPRRPRAYVPALVAPSTSTLAAGPGRVADDVVSVSTATSVLVAESEPEESAYQRGSTEAEVDEDDITQRPARARARHRRLRPPPHVGRPPVVRVNGELKRLDDQPMLTRPAIQRMVYAILTQKQREKFEDEPRARLAYSVPGRAGSG